MPSSSADRMIVVTVGTDRLRVGKRDASDSEWRRGVRLCRRPTRCYDCTDLSAWFRIRFSTISEGGVPISGWCCEAVEKYLLCTSCNIKGFAERAEICPLKRRFLVSEFINGTMGLSRWRNCGMTRRSLHSALCSMILRNVRLPGFGDSTTRFTSDETRLWARRCPFGK